MTPIDYLQHVRDESARFVQCLAAADPSARVPSCPDWDAADLAWHLTEVQQFWCTIVAERLDDPEPAEAMKPERPADYQELLTLFTATSGTLVDVLTSTPPSTQVWTWADDHTVGFVRRRQAHEALIHRLDAELALGEVTAFDPALATDGIDEALRVMYGDPPSWSTFTSDGTLAAVETTDTGAAWGLTFGRFTGTSPNTGTTYDDDIFVVADTLEAAPAFTLRGKAGDLDAWLWSRAGEDRVEVVGDRTAFGRLAAIVSQGIA